MMYWYINVDIRCHKNISDLLEIETYLPEIETALPEAETALLEIKIVAKYDSRFQAGLFRFVAGRYWFPVG